MVFFSYPRKKKGFEILCKLSPVESNEISNPIFLENMKIFWGWSGGAKVLSYITGASN